ncbi:MAG: Clp protease ClpP [Eggerthellaceae bacterium]|nr:Clp protease ClpP [Eggerthellaceae bacterium]
MLKIKNEGERATVYLYGEIGESFWGEDDNRAKDFAKLLEELEPKPLDIRIDSCGGDVYEGFAMASAIMRYKGDTHAYIDGIAASAASYIALMADSVSMYSYSMLMIHNAWTIAVGNSEEIRETADKLDALDGTIAGIIAARSNLDIDEVREAMAAESWYSAEAARDAGMADDIIETEVKYAASIDRRIADHFRRIPDNVAVVDGPLAIRHDLGEGDEGEPEENAPSHADSTISDNGGSAPVAILLGNRIYRKENGNENK